MKFRKKPVVIEAQEVSRILHQVMIEWDGLPQWIRDGYERGELFFGNGYINVHTLEGTMRANKGDFIICGVKGELYPCKPDIFWETYEQVEDK